MEFTLNELLRVALGSPQITTDSLNILYAVIRGLLVKLKCENETIKIVGPNAVCLKQLLMDYDDTAKPKFQYNNIETFQKQFNKTDLLIKRLNNMEHKFDDHLAEKRKKIADLNQLFRGKEWGKGTVEELCSYPRESHAEVCTIVHSGAFNCKLRRYVLIWLMERMDNMEISIQQMMNKLDITKKRIEEINTSMSTLETLVHQIMYFKEKITNNRQIVLDTMKEFDEMYLCKVDRIQLPCLMNYLRNRFSLTWDAVERLIKSMNQMNKCVPKKYHYRQNRCLSCGQIKGKKPIEMQPINMKEECDDYQRCSLNRDVGLLKRLNTATYVKETKDYYEILGYLKSYNEHKFHSVMSNRSVSGILPL